MIRSTEATGLAGAWRPLTLAVSVLLLILLLPLVPARAVDGSIGYDIAVSKSGAGTGTVASNPTGIACGSTCQARFSFASSVELSARADAGSRFVGWTGSCTGSGACVVDPPTDGLPASVGAEFEKVPAAKPSIRLLGKPTVRSLRVRIGCGGPDACRLQISVQLVQAGQVSMSCCKAGWDIKTSTKLSAGAGVTALADEASRIVNLQAGAPGRALRKGGPKQKNWGLARRLVIRVRNTATGLSSKVAIKEKGICSWCPREPKKGTK